MRARLCSSIVVLVAASCVVLYAALPASDAFTRADAGSLGANWTNTENGFSIISNTAAPTANSADNIAVWNADVFSANQYSQVTIASFTGSAGVVCRGSGTSPTHSGYLYHQASSASTIYKIVSGAYTSLGSASYTPISTDVLKITCVGTTISALVNGVTKVTLSDASIATGSAGIYGSSTSLRLDDWSGDNIGGGGGSAPTLRLLLGCCDDLEVMRDVYSAGAETLSIAPLQPGQSLTRLAVPWRVGQIERAHQQGRATEHQGPIAQVRHKAEDYTSPASQFARGTR